MMRCFCLGLLTCLAVALVSTGPAGAQTLYVDEQFGFAQTTGVVFASKPVGSPATNMDLQLELFQPEGVGVPTSRAAIILIHGGGFTGGSRFNSRLIDMCEGMARRGYTCVSIDYRLEGDDPVIGAPYVPIETAVAASGDSRATAIAAAAEDGWAAYEWMVANAAGLGVDVDRIGVGGSSAGAVTSLMLAYVLDKVGIAPANAFGAVFDMWGTLGDAPTTLVSGDAPLLIAHGENDTTVPVSGAYALEARAIAVGLTHEIHVVEGAGHGFNIFTQVVAPGQTMFDRFVDFFYQHVANSGTPAVPALGPRAQMLLLGLLLALGVTSLGLRRRAR